MWSIGEVKARGKMAFKANYWKSVLVSFILSLLLGGTAVNARANGGSGQMDPDSQEFANQFNSLYQQDQKTAVAVALGLLGLSFIVIVVIVLLKIFLFNPLKVGGYAFFRENVRTNGGAALDELGSGFGNYGHTFLTLFLTDLFTLLWCFLFLIPGIVKAYSYRMVPFILKDRPELSATEVITESRRMMNGHKWNTFLLDLSFIGWLILTVLTLGIVGIFWTGPYMDNTNAALYLELRDGQRN